MIWTLLIVGLVCAVALVVGRAWIGRRATHQRARRLEDGTQEVRVIVDRGYLPSRIDLEARVPATLRFERRGEDPCTELLVSELWPSAHQLVAHGETAIRFTPERPGRFAFTCGMGMYSGEIVVRAAARPTAVEGRGPTMSPPRTWPSTIGRHGPSRRP